MKTILIAEDELEVRDYLSLAVNCQGYDVELARNGVEALDCLRRLGGSISLLLLDLLMPYKDGFETLKEVRSNWPGLPVIALSGSCTPANVASVLKAGAVDFLSKPVSHEELGDAIRAALNLFPPSRLNDRLSPCPVDLVRPSRVTWSQRIEGLISRVGASDVPVLLRGETGVGKEVVARKLHQRSKRAGRPFLKLNCAALPSELAESELFGYERGAFTGAFKATPGKFEMANGGTILLDEIGDMELTLQAKLLQVLQDREFLRLGAKDTSRVDVRVMAATHCDLERAVSSGRFRQDLYYRLNIVEVHIPPLRERKDEILDLAQSFVQKYSPGEEVELPSRLKNSLLEHDWPGNVRELENIIRKFLVFRSTDLIANELKHKGKTVLFMPLSSESDRARPRESASIAENGSGILRSSERFRADIETVIFDGTPPRRNAGELVPVPRRDPILSPQPVSALAEVDDARRKAEADAILAALNSTLWNRKHAAKLLNVEYKVLLYKMKKLGLAGKKMISGE